MQKYNQKFVNESEVKDGMACLPKGEYAAGIYFGNCCKLADGSVVGSNSRMGEDCVIGNGCVIGNNCEIGDNCTIGHGVVIGDNCTIGADCAVGDNCTIRNNCEIGDYFEAGDKCVIGNDCAFVDEFQLMNQFKLGERCTRKGDILKKYFKITGIGKDNHDIFVYITAAQTFIHHYLFRGKLEDFTKRMNKGLYKAEYKGVIKMIESIEKNLEVLK